MNTIKERILEDTPKNSTNHITLTVTAYCCILLFSASDLIEASNKKLFACINLPHPPQRPTAIFEIINVKR